MENWRRGWMGDVLYTSGASENLNNAFMDQLANSVWITDAWFGMFAYE